MEVKLNKDKPQSKIYDIGQFTLKDNKCKLKFVGTVEKIANQIKVAHWIYFDNKESGESISFALNNIEMRSLVHALRDIISNKESKYIKNTGGHSTTKRIEIESGKDMVNLKSFHGPIHVFYNIDKYAAMSLCDEVDILCEACIKSVYTLQQVIAKAKRTQESKIKKEKQEDVTKNDQEPYTKQRAISTMC